MHRGNPRQTLIVGVERGGDRRNATHEPVHWRLAVVGALQQSLDFVSLAHNRVPRRSISDVCPSSKPSSVKARPRLSAPASLRRQKVWIMIRP
jgi:hypothetical protein